MDLQNETWRAVPGFEGHYEVSDMGRVRSLDRKIVLSNGRPKTLHGRVLAPRLGVNGRPQYNLFVNGTRRPVTGYALVLEAFVGPRPEGAVVRHLNDVPADNRLCNLAYGTQRENIQDSVRNGLNKLASQTHCKRGHLLVEPNLRRDRKYPTRRGCRACGNATCHINQRSRLGQPVPDFQAYANERYAIIMGQAPPKVRTHCNRGHEFTPENTSVNKTTGGRQCRICVRMNSAKTTKRRRLARQALAIPAQRGLADSSEQLVLAKSE